MNEWDLSKDQKLALTSLNDWILSTVRSNYITLGGYAGTGKTTLISIFREQLLYEMNVAFLAFTGKATSILRNKLISADGFIRPTDYVGTIHSFLYKPVLNEKMEIIGFTLKDSSEFPKIDLIVLDESSMVNEDTFKDLLNVGVPIICIGDHGQLPPVSDNGFNLMKNPDIRLETIHRYNEDSDLLKLSMMVRYEGKIPKGKLGKDIVKVNLGNNLDKFISIFSKLNDYICLCGTNRNRVLINRQFRRSLGLPFDKPVINDRVIPLKNNKKSINYPIYNGMLGTIKYIKNFNSIYSTKIEFDNEDSEYIGVCPSSIFNKEFINPLNMEVNKKDIFISFRYDYNLNKSPKLIDLFDYGYCITVHKSQGSEWNNVMLFEDSKDSMDEDTYKKWLYTAVTRSRNKLLILEGDGNE